MNKTQAIIDLVDQYGAHNYQPLPVVISEAKGVWMTDVEGRRYLDCLSAYSAVSHGHGHPRILRALHEQADRLVVTSRAFHNDQLGPWCKELTELCGLDMALPMNTGAEAVETAIKAARKWGYQVKKTPKYQAKIICCANNFHGRTVTAISLSSEALYREDFGPFTPGFEIIPYGDLPALEAAIDENTIAFLVEPIQGEAGVKMPPAGYLAAARKLCDKNNMLLILDEIQTGLGRTGKLFAWQHENAKPDLMCLGKALGGGCLPVSAVVGRKEVLGLFRPGEHGSTFGGMPLSCAVSREALRVLVEEDLAGRAERLGARLRRGLEAIKCEQIKEVRGKGLLIAVEFKPGPRTARGVCEALQREGILCKETHEKIVRFAPPLVIAESEIDLIINAVKKILEK
jgi:ornithine--oxo-acid transaminase